MAAFLLLSRVGASASLFSSSDSRPSKSAKLASDKLRTAATLISVCNPFKRAVAPTTCIPNTHSNMWGRSFVRAPAYISLRGGGTLSSLLFAGLLVLATVRWKNHPVLVAVFRHLADPHEVLAPPVAPPVSSCVWGSQQSANLPGLFLLAVSGDVETHLVYSSVLIVSFPLLPFVVIRPHLLLIRRGLKPASAAASAGGINSSALGQRKPFNRS